VIWQKCARRYYVIKSNLDFLKKLDFLQEPEQGRQKRLSCFLVLFFSPVFLARIFDPDFAVWLLQSG